MAKTFLLAAAICAMLAVALGAFGAHGLKHRLTVELMAAYQTGVQYHFYHSFLLLVVALLLLQFPGAALFQWTGWLALVGIILFSGSLYVMALTGIKVLGAITPIGGLAFIGAWLLLAIGAYRHLGS
ncbi:MAG: uncharacterized membrane protein YgdD (TMEM256/DUF423 family) [Paraglaciecola psychrophila]